MRDDRDVLATPIKVNIGWVPGKAEKCPMGWLSTRPSSLQPDLNAYGIHLAPQLRLKAFRGSRDVLVSFRLTEHPVGLKSGTIFSQY